MQNDNGNINGVDTTVSREQHKLLNGHRGAVLWFTGLSGPDKSTLSNAVEQRPHQPGDQTFLLHYENICHGLRKNIGFSYEDHTENIRLIGEVAKLLVDAGVVLLATFISPYRIYCEIVRSLMRSCDFNEVYCQRPLEVCEQRDVKGLYKEVLTCEISNFTSISALYEAPLSPEGAVNTAENNFYACVERVLAMGNLSLQPCNGTGAMVGN